MLSSGNSLPMVCVGNLLKITRGEVPYERLKGIDPTIIDKPYSLVAPLLVEEARWNIKTYEPRVNVDEININAALAESGNFKLEAEIEEG